jgi:hypothetical protein
VELFDSPARNVVLRASAPKFHQNIIREDLADPPGTMRDLIVELGIVHRESRPNFYVLSDEHLRIRPSVATATHSTILTCAMPSRKQNHHRHERIFLAAFPAEFTRFYLAAW